jgi:hypothetical protein
MTRTTGRLALGITVRALTRPLRPIRVDLRLVVVAFVAAIAAVLAAQAPFDAWWAGEDFSRYLDGARALWSGDWYAATGYVYSPAFALLISPLAAMPFGLALALWRAAELAALAYAARGAGPLAPLIFVMPWLWSAELVVGNVTGFATAAMILVVVRPSVRTVILYAVLVALVPKPAFLPVMLYAIVAVPEARRWVIAIGLAGMAMLAWPGYLEAILHGTDGAMAAHWPQPWALLAAAMITVGGLWWPRLLGVASLLMSPYLWLYMLTPLATLLVVPDRGNTSLADGRRTSSLGGLSDWASVGRIRARPRATSR